MKSKFVAPLSLAAAVASLFFQVEMVSSQVAAPMPVAQDPGVRGGVPGAGGPIAGLTGTESAFFTRSRDTFQEVDGVAQGLGPRMNLDQCSGCHTQPAVGGTSPFVNPQVAFAHKDGGTDFVPSFINANGPVREARFVRNPDGTADGGVHDLFTITGRTGATGCTLAQPDFATQLANNNVIFRIPTPVFGAGLIEQIPDSTILANMSSNASQKGALGIRDHANFDATGRTVTGISNNNGKSLFSSIGCALCHTPTLTTGNSAVAALRNQPANLFSDVLVHDMGDGLADGVSQGQAGPREFRSAPLWGLGQRIFFLHDGRTSDLLQAIQAHSSTGSEANGVIGNFNHLPQSKKQDLLNFLRSL